MSLKEYKREGIQLAYPADTGKILRLGQSFICQPKFRGERCRVEWFHGEPCLISSYGNHFKFLDHITEELKFIAKAAGEIPFDGEVYKHGWEAERIDSALRRKVNYNPDVQKLELHIFDVQDGLSPQYKRTAFLDYLKGKGIIGNEGSSLQVAPWKRGDIDNWREIAKEYLDEGYEGLIMRGIEAPYVLKRSVAMLKYKPTEVDKYIIMAIQEAISKEGETKGMVGSFLVHSPGNITDFFSVGAGKMNHSERIRIWNSRKDFLGKTLVVKHEPIKTSGGFPVCAVALKIEEV